jgi:hypothetical protein
VTDCGECGTTCASINGTAACVDGACVLTCDPGFGDCDGDPENGCEQPLDVPGHCGRCFNTCTAPNATGSCFGGVCEFSCAPGRGDCNDDMLDGCETTLDRDENCGGCEIGCTSSCVDSTCETCDADLAMAADDPYDAARAMGICGGVRSARWVLPDGNDPPAGETQNANFHLGHGILPNFGPNVPRFGSNMLVLSSGTARRPTDPDYQSVSGFSKGYSSGHPFGFPKESPSCPGVITGTAYDGVALELELEVPEWAHGLAFDFNFYTFEWPGWVCSTFNDFFVALLSPFPQGQTDGNISFDSMGNPVSVNNAFLSVCGCSNGPPCTAGGKTFTCPNGTDELMNTGFEGHAGTSWLTTTAPVEPDTVVTLTLMIYDSGDGSLDSTVLIDNFRWVAKPTDVVTEPID